MAQSPELSQSSNNTDQQCRAVRHRGVSGRALADDETKEAREDLADDGGRLRQLVRLEEHDVVTHVTRRLVGRATHGDRTWCVLFALRCGVARW